MGVSLQDAGRSGYLRYGVSEAGPMDWARHQMANHMLGKAAGSTAIEVGPAGLGMSLDEGELQISFAGPGFVLKLDDQSYTGPLRMLISAGQQLEIIPQRGAMWGYLGFRADLQLPSLLGSQAENSVSGLAVMKIRPGVRLEIKRESVLQPAYQQYVDPFITEQFSPIGILPSSQYDHFSAQMKLALVKKTVSISSRFDRMAYRLEHVHLLSDQGHDILSDGITMGAIQVPGDGRPFILMADHQPTGGYPKIACVCKADMPRLAQMSPGQAFELAWLDLDVAIRRWQGVQQQIASLTALRGAS